MHLPEDAANPGPVHANHHKQVLHHKSHPAEFVDDLDVGQPLLVGAHFVLAFYYVDSIWLEDAVGFPCAHEVEVKDRLVILLRAVLSPVVGVIDLEVLVLLVGSPARCVHVRRVKNHAVHRGVTVREFPTIHARAEVGGAQIIGACRDILPKHPLAIGHIRNQAALGHIEPEDLWKDLVIRCLVSREEQLVGGNAPSDPVGLLCLKRHGIGDHG
jgi:hypothetical protein